MKQSQLVELLANIKATLVSFFSIVMFVMLGVGLYLGIRGSALSLESAAELKFEQDLFHDFDVTFPYGLSQDDLDAIRELEGVDLVEPAYVAYASQHLGGARYTLAIRSITTDIDLTEIVEGELPTAKGEVAIGRDYAGDHGLGIGDTIELVHDADDADGMRLLTTSELTITGIATNPTYISEVGGMLGVSDTGSAVETFAYTVDDTFDPAAYGNHYPCAYVRAASLRGIDTFSDEYREAARALEAQIVELGEPRAQARRDQIKAEAQAQVDAAQAQIDAGQAQIDSANKQIADGEKAIAEGQRQVDVAIGQLQAGRSSYEATEAMGNELLGSLRESLSGAQADYDTAKAQLDEKTAQHNALKAEVDLAHELAKDQEDYVNERLAKIEALDAQLEEEAITQEEHDAQVAALRAEITAKNEEFVNAVTTELPIMSERFPELKEAMAVDPDDPNFVFETRLRLLAINGYLEGADALLSTSYEQLSTVEGQVASLGAQLDSAWQQYYDAQARLDSALSGYANDIASGESQVSEGQATIAQKTTELEEGRQTVAEKTEELGKAKDQVADAQRQVDSIAFMSWIVSTRHMASGSIALNNILGLTNNLRVAMASLFVVVGLLVCYSAVSRIVHEQTRQIGTKKALGFRNHEVTLSYLAYTALAVALGVVLGIALSVFVVQAILYGRIAGTFMLPRMGATVDPEDTAFISAVELVLLLACTWLACRSVLKRNAVDLLAGEGAGNGTQHFYERWRVWKRLPLLTQTVINNCVSDPRRVFGTLVGVAGCTALIVTAATLDGNITRSLEEHFGTVYDYDVRLAYNPEVEGAREAIDAVLAEQGAKGAGVRYAMYLFEDEGEPAYEFVYVPEDEEAFAELFHLNVVPSQGSANASGVWVSEAHAAHRGLKVGDTIQLCSVSGERYRMPIAGFFTYYLPNNAMVMSADNYEKIFGREATPNGILVDTGDGSSASLRSALSSVDGFVSLADERASVEAIVRLFKSVTTTVVAIYLALSALMAVIVLLNLDYMFIDEKKRELIVLMINGFSVHDAKAYIYRDAIVMTALGIVCGVCLGVTMGAATVGAVEWQSCCFIKDAYLPACLLGAGASAVFAAAMMLLALRRIPRFSLTDIARF